LDGLSLQLDSGNIILLVAAIAAGIGLSFWTYRRTIPRTSNAKRRILITLRSFAIAIIIFIIFQPILSLTRTSERTPEIALALDRSRSMQLPQSGDDTVESNSRRNAMTKSINQILPNEVHANTKEVVTFGFDEQTDIITTPIDSVKTNGLTTDISSLFSAISQKSNEKNFGAIILYSDGAFTAGANPIYAAEKLGVPVYAVGLGDSAERRDVAITDLFTSEVATVGIAQPVDVNLRITGMLQGEKVRVTLVSDENIIGETDFVVRDNQNDYTTSFQFTPKKEGTLKLTAKASSASSETTLKNNLRISYVRVLKNTFRIVLIAGAPSSDVSFIRNFYSGRKEIELVTYIGKQGAEFYEGKLSVDKVNNADLVILIGYPIAETTPDQLNIVKRLLINESRSLLFIPSRQVDYVKLKEFEDALPFTLSQTRIATNEIKVSTSLNPAKADDPIMRSGSDRGEAATNWEGLAPLIKTETNFSAKPEAEVLAEASIQGVNLGQPLIISRRLGRSRQIAFTGYGLWQWKLVSFGREKVYQSLSRTNDTTNLQSALDIFLGNATRWLVTRDDQKQVRIAPTRKLYEAGERIEFTGQVFDESFLPVDGAIVSTAISGASIAAPINLTLEPLVGGRYAVRLPQGLPAGDYVYSGEAKKDEKSLGIDGGRFNVGEYSAEFAEPRMRSDILRALAEKTGGKFYTPQTAASLLADSKANPRFRTKIIENTSKYEARNTWQLLVLAICLFAVEWFIRKRVGML
jgi:hypothetical protein